MIDSSWNPSLLRSVGGSRFAERLLKAATVPAARTKPSPANRTQMTIAIIPAAEGWVRSRGGWREATRGISFTGAPEGKVRPQHAMRMRFGSAERDERGYDGVTVRPRRMRLRLAQCPGFRRRRTAAGGPDWRRESRRGGGLQSPTARP